MRGRVLIVDDDRDISTMVAEVLSDEGFVISELRNAQLTAIQAEIARVEPDVVLLDGDGRDYGYSWVNAAWMRQRNRPIPVIMFTAHAEALIEAEMAVSDRARNAAFVGILAKPFDVQTLVETVARAVDDARPIV
jgi:DNA-binding NtrC family response regulator